MSDEDKKMCGGKDYLLSEEGKKEIYNFVDEQVKKCKVNLPESVINQTKLEFWLIVEKMQKHNEAFKTKEGIMDLFALHVSNKVHSIRHRYLLSIIYFLPCFVAVLIFFLAFLLKQPNLIYLFVGFGVLSALANYRFQLSDEDRAFHRKMADELSKLR